MTRPARAMAPRAMEEARSPGCSARYCVPTAMISLLTPEEACRPDEQHDGHDHEDDDVRGLRVEDLGQTFEHAENVARDDGAEDRPHAADHHHGKDDDDDVRTHEDRK